MANPVPEVQPEEVRDDVAIMATGRSDYPNQINNVLAFPGVFKGALEVPTRWPRPSPTPRSPAEWHGARRALARPSRPPR
jgi:hypothetical protein